MNGILHYRGDRREALAADELMGPGRGGDFFVVEAAEYDPATNMTTAHMRSLELETVEALASELGVTAPSSSRQGQS